MLANHLSNFCGIPERLLKETQLYSLIVYNSSLEWTCIDKLACAL